MVTVMDMATDMDMVKEFMVMLTMKKIKSQYGNVQKIFLDANNCDNKTTT